ncbi:zinc finger, CCHC-type containing protein [Tanacetum coccineum]
MVVTAQKLGKLAPHCVESHAGSKSEIQGCDAVGKAGISALVKCTFAIRQLAYDVVPDSLDEYLQIGEKTFSIVLMHFCNGDIEYMARVLCEGLRKLTSKNSTLFTRTNMGFLFEQWKPFFNVLRQSPVLNDLKVGKAPEVPFVANDVTYKWRYYLTDGIYPEWVVLMKSISQPGSNDVKRIRYKQSHESARKDVEGAFGVLKKKWAIVRTPARSRSLKRITHLMPVMEQYNEILRILGQFTQHKMNMYEAISVSCVIDKLPPSWKDFKHTLKHKKGELALVKLDSHLRIEKSLRAQEIDKPRSNNVAGILVVNMVELNNSTSDLCDLLAMPTLRNKKHFVTFINDASKFCYVYLLHTKDEALDKFKVFRTKVELQQGALIKRLRFNRGCESMDTLYFQLVGDRGIDCIFIGYVKHSVMTVLWQNGGAIGSVFEQFANQMNDMMNPRRCRDRNDRRIEDEELGNPFFEGDCSSSNEWGDYGVAGDDYEGALVFDDNYQEAPVFDDDQLEEPMQVYDTDIEMLGLRRYKVEVEVIIMKGEFDAGDTNLDATRHSGWYLFFYYVNSRVPLFSLHQLVSEPKFLIKMPPRRTRNIIDVYDRIMAKMEEQLD